MFKGCELPGWMARWLGGCIADCQDLARRQRGRIIRPPERVICSTRSGRRARRNRAALEAKETSHALLIHSRGAHSRPIYGKEKIVSSFRALELLLPSGQQKQSLRDCH